MIRTWQRCAALLAIFWPAIRYFGIERPFLVPRFPIAPSVPEWIDWLLDLPLIVAMVGIGMSVAPRWLPLLVLLVTVAHTMLTAAMAWWGLPYYSTEGLGDARLLLVSLVYGCIYLGVPTLIGFLARHIGVAARLRPDKS